MKLPNGFTSQQIRVLQEFRRKAQDELSPEEINTIHHPGGGGGESPARELAGAGLLAFNDGAYRLTDRAKDFLARPSVPLYGGGGGDEAE